nr:hypothetical protein [uncultured Psychroserpens sp.]
MKKLALFSFTMLFLSCVVEEDTSSLPPEPETVDINLTTNVLTLEHEQLDVFFYTTNSNNRFIGINNNLETELTASLDSEFEIPEDSFGFNAYAESLIQVNDRYDLIKGSVTKFLNTQNIVRNDTIFAIQGFSEQTQSEYLLFDKQTFKFKELEEGFFIANSLYNPIQVIDNKMYYIKNIPSDDLSYINYIDLENPNAPPQTLHASEHIVWFLINQQMDLYIRAGSSFSNTYIPHASTGLELTFFDADNPLKSHFISIDGQIYAQNYLATAEQLVKGIYALQIEDDTVTGTEIFSFNNDNYPGISYLGDSDFVIPNTSRNNDLIISTNTGLSSMYIYELDVNLGTINPLDININGVGYINYYQNNFFVLSDFFSSSSNYRLRKFDLSNLSTLVEINLGQSINGIIINNNGSIFGLKNEGGDTKLVEIKSNNTIVEIDVSNDLYGYFSIID